MNKKSIYLLGLITLLLFPIPTFIGLYWLENIFPLKIFEFENLSILKIGLGIQLGVVYAFLAILFMNAPIFKDLSLRIENVIQSMNLNLLDCIFISICAGFGEEILFRSGIQFYLGPIITSIIFVGIHGYLNPLNWKASLYGFIILPFILLISYGYEEFGLWFAIGAHTSYDLILLMAIRKSTNNN